MQIDKIDKVTVFTGVAHADKYHSGNWIADNLVKNFLKTILAVTRRASNNEVHEVGCGEGHILGVLATAGFNVRGSDVSHSAMEVARLESLRHGLNIPIIERSIYEVDVDTDSAETVLCCEVLEHLTDPELALIKLLSITRRDLIVSVPNEPIWHILNMVRGKYWNALGNTPGHFNHWTPKQFTAFVSKHADVLSVLNPLPWTIVHCRPRKK